MGFLTVRFDDTGDGPPALPANAAPVTFRGSPSNNDPTQLNVAAHVQGDGNASHFLAGDGTFKTAGGGGSGPGNLVSLPTLSSTSGLADWTLWIRISAGSVLIPSAGKIKLGIFVTTGPYLIDKAFIKRANAFDLTAFTDSTQITWSGSNSVSLSAGLTLSDDITVNVDLLHDYIIMFHTDPSNTGAAGAINSGYGLGDGKAFDAHRDVGDWTTNTLAQLYTNINADALVGFQQIIATP